MIGLIQPTFLPAELTRFAAAALISSTWQAGVLVAAVAACLALIPRASATLRYAIWTSAFLLFTVLPMGVLFAARHGQPQPTAQHAVQLDPRWSIALAALWLAASLVRAIQLAVSAIRLRALAQTATPVSEWPACTAPGTNRTAILCTSDEVARPSVIGFFHPRILIPVWLHAELSKAELTQVVLHEMQHLRRRDDWMNLVQKLALVVFPLNPALLWVERRLCFERELACDDGVLSVTHAPRAYATCLLHLAERSLVRSRLSLALGAWERRSELARRVHTILRARNRQIGSKPAAALAATVIAALLGGTTALTRTPEFVTFTTPITSLAESSPITLNPDKSLFHETTFKVPAQTECPRYGAAPCALPGVTANTTQKPKVRVIKLAIKRHAAHLTPIGRQQQPGKPAGFTLTALDQPEPTQPATPRLTFTVIRMTASPVSYAAVPTPDGWIIFQL